MVCRAGVVKLLARCQCQPILGSTGGAQAAAYVDLESGAVGIHVTNHLVAAVDGFHPHLRCPEAGQVGVGIAADLQLAVAAGLKVWGEVEVLHPHAVVPSHVVQAPWGHQLLDAAQHRGKSRGEKLRTSPVNHHVANGVVVIRNPTKQRVSQQRILIRVGIERAIQYVIN